MKSKLKQSIEKRAISLIKAIGLGKAYQTNKQVVDAVAKALLKERRQTLDDAIKACKSLRCPGSTPFDCDSDRTITFYEGTDKCVTAIIQMKKEK